MQRRLIRRTERGEIFVALMVAVPLLLMGSAKVFDVAFPFDPDKVPLQIAGEDLPQNNKAYKKWLKVDDSSNAYPEVVKSAEAFDVFEKNLAEDIAQEYPQWKGDGDDIWSLSNPRWRMDETIPDDWQYQAAFMRRYAVLYQNIMQDLEPVLDLAAEASKKKCLFREYDPKDQFNYLMNTRILALMLALKTRYDLRVLQDVQKCQEDIEVAFKIGRLALSGGYLINKLVGVAMNGIACSSFQLCLMEGGLTPQQLRALAKRIGQYELDLPQEWTQIVVAERVIILQGVDNARGTVHLADWFKLAVTYRPMTQLLSGVAYFSWLYGVSNYDVHRVNDRLAQMMAKGEDPKLLLEFARQTASPQTTWDTLLRVPFPLSSAVQSENYTTALLTLFKINNTLRLCQVAALLQADRMEHKPLPKDLSAYPQRDVFTGQPFKLAVEGEWVLIYSLGPDGKDSGKWVESDPGKMRADPEGDEQLIHLPVDIFTPQKSTAPAGKLPRALGKPQLM